MSVHTVPADPRLLPALSDIQTTPLSALPRPQSATWSPDGLSYVFIFTPDLTPAETQLFDDGIAAMRSGTGLSTTDYQAIRTQMQTLRAMRQLGRNAYVNLTEAERNRQTYDCLVAITEIFLKLTREV